jgi:hypothetical protein
VAIQKISKKIMGEGQAHLTDLKHGPLLKNKYTMQLEHVVKTYLKCDEKDKIEIVKKGEDYFITLDGVDFNLTKIIKYANFNHLNIDSTYDDLYTSYLSRAGINFKLNNSLQKLQMYSVTDTLFKMLKSGMHAINVYTGNYGFSSINQLLRYGPYATDKDSVMVPLCTAFFASHALNQTAEVSPNAVFRCVKGMGLPDPQKLTALAKQGELSKESFFSTTLGHPLWDIHYTHFIYCETNSAYINELSKCNGEYEVLIPPSHFQWTHHEEDEKGNKYYIVKPVAALNLLDPEEHKGIFDRDGDPNEVDSQGNTPLHFAILLQPSLCHRLVQAGANVNKPNNHGVTPFHLVAKTGDEALIAFFLNHNATLLLKDVNQKTPYDFLQARQLSNTLKKKIQEHKVIEAPTLATKLLSKLEGLLMGEKSEETTSISPETKKQGWYMYFSHCFQGACTFLSGTNTDEKNQVLRRPH